MEKLEENGPRKEGNPEAYTRDGTVSLRGKPVLISRSGGWKACSFFLAYEVFERMAFYGIASNLVVYLSVKLHEGTVKSSNNVTTWTGAVWMFPIIGAYIADAHLGRYWTFVTAAALYLSGMSLLTLTVSVPGLKPPSCDHGGCDKSVSSFQKGIFYLALYAVAAGAGGTKPNISTMGADQFDDSQPKERQYKLSFFNWWFFGSFFGALISNSLLIYIQDNAGWSLGYGLPTLGLAVSIGLFLIGTPLYRHKLPAGSPFTKIAQVLIAAVRKWRMPVPDDPKQLYELGLEEYSRAGKYKIDHTNSLRFLDKAAVKIASSSTWMLCPVTQVEETKQMIKMVPVLAITIIPNTIIAQMNTLFIKQGTTLNRSLGPHFQIPSGCLTAFVTIFMLVSLVLYDRWFMPFVKRYTKNPRGITLLQRMAIGFVLHLVIMATACLVERKRLTVAREHNKLGRYDEVPLSIFVLLPQFALVGIADCFLEVAKLEFFYDQAPEGMKSLGTSYFSSGIGLGQFFSSFLLAMVSNITKKNGHNGWILDNLNISHLDYYYAFLGILGLLNFLVFLVVAKYFIYNVDVDTKRNEKQDMAILPGQTAN
ncbi:Protein NRT1/ PTR FAMILY 5.2 [Linum grandiflorum]